MLGTLLVTAMLMGGSLAKPAGKDIYDPGNTYQDSFARNKMLPIIAATNAADPSKCLYRHFLAPTSSWGEMGFACLVGINEAFQLKRVVTLPCSKLELDKCGAYTAYDTSDEAIFIAFRATKGGLQMFLESEETAFGNKTSWPSGGMVSEYFGHAFLVVWNGGMKDDVLQLKAKYPTYQLWVAGHSLGAAMASVAASYISALGIFDKSQIKLVTIGQPRVGDLDYAHGHDSTVPYSFRVTHAHDMVPHLPLNGEFQYHHHKSEIWYNNPMAINDTFQECDADDAFECSNRQLNLKWSDHDYYYDVNVVDWGTADCPI